jgi:ecotin
MRTIVSIALLTFAVAASSTAADNMQATTSDKSSADNMRAFPPAEPGMTRHVIRLAEQKDEADFKVELIVGKTVRTDAANRYFFAGALETENIPGWGFPRYVLRKLGPMAGTLMAVDSNAPQVDRFVALGSETVLHYNSRLPVVVYVPTDVEVRYRIWRAEKTLISPPEEPTGR